MPSRFACIPRLGFWLLAIPIVLFCASEVQAAMRPLVIRGTLRYHRGGSKRFVWKLKYSTRSGLCVGRSKDRDGTATFNGYYNRRNGKFLLRKTYINRKKGTRSFYYKGRVRRGKVKGTAHQKSYSGPAYARWYGTLSRRVSAPTPSPGPGFKGRSPRRTPQPSSPGYDPNNPFGGSRSPGGNGVFPPSGGRGFGSGGGGGYGYRGRSRRGYGSGYVKRFVFRGRLYYTNGAASKSFSWTLRYYPRTGLCFGSVRDVDGYASFNGSYNSRTGRIFLTKTYINRRSGTRRFYYKGYVGSTRAYGTSHFSSYYGRSYGRWTARLTWSSGSLRARRYRAPRRNRYGYRRHSRYGKNYRLMRFRGYLYYTNGAGSKAFSWTLRYYPRTGLCMGRVRDKDGTATFNGSFNKQTGRFFLTKTFLYRRSGTRSFYYKGYITRRGARGTAHQYSYYGRSYGTWNARLLSNN